VQLSKQVRMRRGDGSLLEESVRDGVTGNRAENEMAGDACCLLFCENMRSRRRFECQCYGALISMSRCDSKCCPPSYMHESIRDPQLWRAGCHSLPDCCFHSSPIPHSCEACRTHLAPRVVSCHYFDRVVRSAVFVSRPDTVKQVSKYFL